MLKKRIIITLLCACLLAGLSVPALAASVNEALNVSCTVVPGTGYSATNLGGATKTSPATWTVTTDRGLTASRTIVIPVLSSVDLTSFSEDQGIVKISFASQQKFVRNYNGTFTPTFSSGSLTFRDHSVTFTPTLSGLEAAYIASLDLPASDVSNTVVAFQYVQPSFVNGTSSNFLETVRNISASVGVNYFYTPSEAENIESIADGIVAQNQLLIQYYGQIITICNQIYSTLLQIEADTDDIYGLVDSISSYLLGDFMRGFYNLQTQVNYILANTNQLTYWIVNREIDPEIDGEPFGNMYEYIRSLWFAVHDPEVSGYEDPFLSSNFFSLIYIKLSDLFDSMFSGTAYTGVSFDSNAGEIVTSALSWAVSVASNLQTLAAESAENQKLSWLAEQKGVLDGVHDSFDKVGVSDVGDTVSTFHDAADTFDTGYGFSDFGDVFDSSDTSLFMWFTQDVKDSLSYGGGSG